MQQITKAQPTAEEKEILNKCDQLNIRWSFMGDYFFINHDNKNLHVLMDFINKQDLVNYRYDEDHNILFQAYGVNK